MNKINTLIYIFIFAIILSAIMPFKETLVCKDSTCTVARKYVYKITQYTFSRNSKFSLGYVRRSYSIHNDSDNYNHVFINPFSEHRVANQVINSINNKYEFEMDKFWIGYKIYKH